MSTSSISISFFRFRFHFHLQVSYTSSVSSPYVADLLFLISILPQLHFSVSPDAINISSDFPVSIQQGIHPVLHFDSSTLHHLPLVFPKTSIRHSPIMLFLEFPTFPSLTTSFSSFLPQSHPPPPGSSLSQLLDIRIGLLPTFPDLSEALIPLNLDSKHPRVLNHISTT